MKKLLFAFFLVSVAMTAIAESFDKRVITYNSPKGSIYFISDKFLSQHSKDISKFEFDITYVENKDSAVINYTVVSGNPSDIAKLALSNGVEEAKADSTELMYHQMKGKKYEVRTTSHICFKDLKKLFTSQSPVEFRMTRTDGTTASAGYSPSQWKKEKELFEKFFYLLNK